MASSIESAVSSRYPYHSRVADELRKRDPGCAISAHNIRQLVLHKEIPSRKAGSKYLVAPDDVERYFGLTIDENEQNHGVG